MNLALPSEPPRLCGSVLLSVRVNIWGFGCGGAVDIFLGTCLIVVVDDRAGRAILVDKLTRYSNYAVRDLIPDSSAWDVLVDE
jgi:hypothetical protein